MIRNIVMAVDDSTAKAYIRARMNRMMDPLDWTSIRIHHDLTCLIYLGKIRSFQVYLAQDPLYFSDVMIAAFFEATKGRSLIFADPSHHADLLYHYEVILERERAGYYG